MAQSESNEHKWIFLSCLLAAVHVFVFSAVFPFFNNVDEVAHFDLVVKYSQGHVPRRLELLSTDSVPYLVLYGSGMYFTKPGYFANGQFPPPLWKQPVENIRQNLPAAEAAWRAVTNYESSQPPLYYSVAGLWWDAGQLLGFKDGYLLYGLRFLNIFFVVALVWLGYLAAKLVFPGQKFLQISVPALVAFLPQTALYSIDNDVLSPLCFGAVFVCLIHWVRAEIPALCLGATMGLLLAATFLVKMTNLPLVGVALAVIGLKILDLARAGKLRAAMPALVLLALCAGLPVIGWAVWCKYHFGDFTGSAVKAGYFGWIPKPFGAWWHHPIFTPHGFWTFISALTATFWQSEFLWHGQPLAFGGVDMVYVILSIGLVGVAWLNLCRKSSSINPAQREALRLALWSCVVAVVFLGFLSIRFDFGVEHNPSRARPYFTAGRLVLGTLIPFLLLFTFGLDRALNRFDNRAKFLALAGMVLFMLVSEISIDWLIFPNPYNWFHL